MIRHTSTKYLFTCQQATVLLEIEAFFIAPRAHFQPRVEILVALFGRTADWRGFAHVIGHLTPLEQQSFYRRVGRENAFDEVRASLGKHAMIHGESNEMAHRLDHVIPFEMLLHIARSA